MMETVLSEESEYEDAGPEWQCEDPEAEYDAPVGDEEGAAEATAEGEESKHDDSTDDAMDTPGDAIGSGLRLRARPTLSRRVASFLSRTLVKQRTGFGAGEADDRGIRTDSPRRVRLRGG